MSEPEKKRIREAAPLNAEGLLAGFDLDQSFPVDVEAVAQGMGIGIERTADDEDGCLVIEDGKATIKISERVAPVRQRFTIAHELGHLALGHEFERTIHRDVSPQRPWKVEREANAWAAQFLMPEDRVRVVAKALSSLEEMASYFNVSTDAMIYRHKDLGIID